MSQPISCVSSALAAALLAAVVISTAPARAHAEDLLPEPRVVIVERSLRAAQRSAMMLAARRYYAFWNTGDERYARQALAADFVDRNLPAGRPQGPSGPLLASRNFRAAVPDLQLAVEEMLVIQDRVIGRLHFSGHYTGVFQGKPGDGRRVDFIAIDIYRIAKRRIAENWHLEDNLTLLQQLGVVPQ
jgi:predicted ester cyclase